MAVLATENTKADTMKLKLPHPGPTPRFLRNHAVALAGQRGEVPLPFPPSIAIQLHKPRPTGSSALRTCRSSRWVQCMGLARQRGERNGGRPVLTNAKGTMTDPTVGKIV